MWNCRKERGSSLCTQDLPDSLLSGKKGTMLSFVLKKKKSSSVERLTLDFGSSRDPGVMRLSPRLGSTLSVNLRKPAPPPANFQGCAHSERVPSLWKKAFRYMLTNLNLNKILKEKKEDNMDMRLCVYIHTFTYLFAYLCVIAYVRKRKARKDTELVRTCKRWKPLLHPCCCLHPLA